MKEIFVVKGLKQFTQIPNPSGRYKPVGPIRKILKIGDLKRSVYTLDLRVDWFETQAKATLDLPPGPERSERLQRLIVVLAELSEEQSKLLYSWNAHQTTMARNLLDDDQQPWELLLTLSDQLTRIENRLGPWRIWASILSKEEGVND